MVTLPISDSQSIVDDVFGTSAPKEETQIKDINQQIVDDVFKTDSSSLKLNVGAAIGTNPDVEADLFKVSQETGMPLEAVRADPENARKFAKMSKLDIMRMEEKSPVVAKVLSENPITARLWHDEIDRLADVEDRVRNLTLAAQGKAPTIQPFVGTDPTMDNIATGLAASIKRPMLGVRTALVDLLETTGIADEQTANNLRRGLRQELSQIDFAQPRIEGTLGKGLYSAAASLPTTAASIAATITAGPSIGSLVAGAATGTESYGRGRLAEDMSREKALAYASFQGGIEDLTERTGLKFLSKVFGKTPVSQLIKSFVADAIGEQAATAGQELVDVAFTDKTLDEYRQEFGDNAATTLVASAVTSGLIGGASHAAYAISGERNRALQALDQFKKQVEIDQQLVSLKSKTRDPIAFENLIKDTVAGGKLKEVFIYADDLDMDTNKALSAISGELDEQIRNALNVGGKFAIPMDIYQSKIAGTELGNKLIDKISFTPYGLNKREAESYLGELDEKIQTALDETINAINEGEESTNQVYKTMVDRLLSAGVPKAVAESNALIHTSFFNTVAKETGISVEAAYAQYGEKAIIGEGYNEELAASLRDESTYADLDIISEIPEKEDYVRFSPRKGEELLSVARAPDEVKGGVIVRSNDKEYSFRVEAENEAAEVTLASYAIKDFNLFKEENPNAVLRAEVTKDSVKNILARRGFEPVAKRDGAIIMEAKDPQRAYALFLQGKVLGTFDPDTRTISLRKSYSVSTFMHETAHLYLEVLPSLAKENPRYATLWQDTLTWFGINEEQWNALTFEEKRRYHESFARSYETYLAEGVAPSSKLRNVFRIFTKWILKTYRTLKALSRAYPNQIQIDDNMRKVFDRLLATDAEIESQKYSMGAEKLYGSAAEAGMTEEDYALYNDLLRARDEEAKEYLARKSLADLNWVFRKAKGETNKRKEEMKQDRVNIKNQVAAELKKEPVYSAWIYLKTGNTEKVNEDGSVEKIKDDAHKLDIAAVNKLYEGKENPLKKLGGIYGKYGIVAKDGLDPDAVALQFGFTDAGTLLSAIAKATPFRQAVEDETDSRMLAKYSKISTPEGLARTVNSAMHTEAHLRFLETEVRAAEKLAGKPFSDMKVIKAYATDLLRRTKIMNLKAETFSSAERRSALEALRLQKLGTPEALDAKISALTSKEKLTDKEQTKLAKLKEDRVKAGNRALVALEKKKQLIQATAAKESLKALRQIDKELLYLKAFEKESVRKKLTPRAVAAIDSILQNVDIKKRTTKKEIGERADLRNWLNSFTEGLNGLDEIPIDLDLTEITKSYKEMTVDDFAHLVETIKVIDTLGRQEKILLTSKTKEEFLATVEILTTNINAVADTLGKSVQEMDAMRSELRKDNKFLSLVKGYLIEHRNLASIIKELDGLSTRGPAWETVVRPMNEAADNETLLRVEAMTVLNAALKEVRYAFNSPKEKFEGLPISLDKGEQLVFVLNMGNESNMQRLLDGLGIDKTVAMRVANNLNETELNFVQKIWALLDTYKNQITEMEESVFGIAPKWIEAQPLTVTTTEGKKITLTGGYYPIKYDPRLGGKIAEVPEFGEVMPFRQGRLTTTPSRKHFKTRAARVAGKPLDFRINGLFTATNTIIHSICWTPWVRDMNKLFNNKDIKKAIVSRYDYEHYDQIVKAVKDIAEGDRTETENFSKILGVLRANTVVARLGWNVLNGFVNTAGITNSIALLSPRWVAVGATEFGKDPLQAIKFVYEKSIFMHEIRSHTLVREQNEIKNVLQAKGEWKNHYDASIFFIMEKTQTLVDMPTWIGAYRKALWEGETEEEAVSMADQAVIDAQGAGQLKDLSAIQRGGAFQKVFSLFSGYFMATYNIAVEKTLKANLSKNWKDPKIVSGLMVDYLTLYALPSLISVYTLSAITGGDEEDKEKEFARQTLGMILNQFVGIREFQPFVFEALNLDKYKGGYSGPASLAIINELGQFMRQAKQGELDAPLRRKFIGAVGLLAGIPSTQINRTLDGIQAISEGKTYNPLAVIAGYRQ